MILKKKGGEKLSEEVELFMKKIFLLFLFIWGGKWKGFKGIT